VKLFASCVAIVALLCATELPSPDYAMFGPHGAFQLEYSKDGFGMRSHGVIERLDGTTNGQTRMYPLPQSSFDTYAKLRPADLKMNPIAATSNQYEREEVIGPHQLQGDKLWFGKSFYDGEGMRGVGAFGYFDTATRQYRLYSPPEVAACEISAILVEPDVVWVALDHFGEDISTFPGGLARWNRQTHAVRRYAIEFVVTIITRQNDSLRLTTNGGYALLKNDALDRYQVRTNASGRTETTRIGRFPPPPSHN
jgi:hypothetical protein